MNFNKNINVVLVCGGRTYLDWEKAKSVLDQTHAEKPIDLIVHGGATGADTLAGDWAKLREIDCLRIPAKWKTYGNKSGPVRNAKMLFVAEPNLVIAFPGKTGTAHMVNISKVAGVEVREIE